MIGCFSISLDLNHAIRALLQQTQCGTYLQVFLAAHVMYPFEKVLKNWSTFVMVIIAKEQANALRSPVAYKSKLRERYSIRIIYSTGHRLVVAAT